MDEAVSSLRLLILAGENYRQTAAQNLGLGITEAQALSYLATQGDRGQNQIADDLGITSSAATALVDRLERQGVAERYAQSQRPTADAGAAQRRGKGTRSTQPRLARGRARQGQSGRTAGADRRAATDQRRAENRVDARPGPRITG